MSVLTPLFSDAHIVRRVLRGKTNDFGVLMQRYLGTVDSVAFSYSRNRADADEIVQEAFTKAYTNLHNLKEPGAFGGWVITIARNVSLSLREKRSRVDFVSPEQLDQHVAQSHDHARADLLALLRVCIDDMPEGEREVLLLHYYDNRSTREIGGLLDISREAAAKRLQRARQALTKEFLDRLDGAKKWEAPRTDRTRLILTGLLTLSPGWLGGTTATAGGAVIVNAAIACVIGTIAAGGIFAAKNMPEAKEPIVETAAPPVSVPAPVQQTAQSMMVVAVPESNIVDSAKLASTTGNVTPVRPKASGTIEVIATDVKGQPAQGATVVVEHVSWKSFGVPPGETIKQTLVADHEGRAVATNMPLGGYSVLAYTETGVFADGGELTEAVDHASVNIVLRPGRRKVGSVRTPDGLPIANATVYVYSSPLFGGVELNVAAAGRATSDADGNFVLQTIPAVAWEFCVAAEGFPTTITPEFAANQEQVDIVMEPGGDLVGSVVNQETGAPMAGIKVLIGGGMDTHELVSGPDGEIEVAGLPKGVVRGIVDDAEYASASPIEFTVTSGQTSSITIPLVIGGAVSGTVLDAATSVPIEGAEVHANPNGNNYLWRESKALTDSSGRFEITGLASGEYRLWASSADGGANAVATVHAGETIEAVQIRIERPNQHSVRVRVVDANEQPVGDAYVGYVDFSGNMSETSRRPDADGTHRLFYAGAGSMLRAWGMEGSSEPTPLPDASGRSSVEVTLKLTRPRDGVVRGTVVDGNGRPISNARVTALIVGLQSVSPIAGFETMADDEGNFVASRLHVDTYELQAGSPSDQGLEEKPAVLGKLTNGKFEPFERNQIAVGPGEIIDDVAIQFIRSMRGVAGNVVDARGAPVAKAMIVVKDRPNSSMTYSKADGSFWLDMNEFEPFTLVATASGHSAGESATAQPGDSDVLITLGDPMSVAGVVTDANTGEPILNCEVAVYSGSLAGGGPTALPSLARADGSIETPSYISFVPLHTEDGEFFVEGVDATLPIVIVRAEGYCAKVLDLTGAVPGALIENVAVALERSGSVKVIAKQTSGQAMRYAKILVALAGGAYVHAGDTDNDGVLVIEGLPIAAIDVLADNYEALAESVTVTPSAEVPTEVSIVAATRVNVHGVIDDPSGVLTVETTEPGGAGPAADPSNRKYVNVTVSMSPVGQTGEPYEDNAGGTTQRHFHFSRVPAGTYQLRLTRPSENGPVLLHEETVTIGSTEPAELKISL